jgi:hypothetical protein
MQIKNSFLVVLLCFAMTSDVQASNGGRWDWIISSLRSMKDSAYQFQQWFSSVKKPLFKKVALVGTVGALAIGSYLLYKNINQYNENVKKKEKLLEINKQIKTMEEKLKSHESEYENTKREKLLQIEQQLKELTDLLETAGLSDNDKKISQEKIEKLRKLDQSSNNNTLSEKENIAQKRSDSDHIPVDKAQEVEFKVGDTVKLVKSDDYGNYDEYINKIATVESFSDNGNSLFVDMGKVMKSSEKNLKIKLSKDHFEKVEPVTQERSITINNPEDVSDKQKEFKEKEALLANFEQEKNNLEKKKLSEKLLAKKVVDFRSSLNTYENMQEGNTKDTYYNKNLKPDFEWLKNQSIETQGDKQIFEALKKKYNEITPNET